MGRAEDSVRVAYLERWPGSGAVSDDLQAWLGELTRLQGNVYWWYVDRRVEVPGGKVSFAGQGPGRMMQVLEAIAGEYGAYEAFVGFAIHHALSYQRFLGG